MIDNGHNYCYFFEGFELNPQRRVLTRDGIPVPLKPKSVELLIALVENRGRAVSKADLLDRVWDGHFVEEKNLSVHVAALRKVFGEGKGDNHFIATHSGTGYSFVAEVHTTDSIRQSTEHTSFRRVVIEEEFENESVESNVGSHLVVDRRTAVTAQNSFRSLAVVAVFVVLLTVAGGFWFLNKAQSGSSNQAVKFRDFSYLTMKKLTTNGKVLRAGMSPDAKMFAYVIGDGNMQSLWIGYVDGGDNLQIRPPERCSYTTPSFSPDGTSFYYSVDCGKHDGTALFRIPVMGGVPEKILDDVKNPIGFSPDGKQFAFVRTDESNGVYRLMVAEVKGKNEREVASRTRDKRFSLHGPSWSPDGKLIAVAGVNDGPEVGYEIFGIDPAYGTSISLTKGKFEALDRVAWLRDGSGLMAIAGGRDELTWNISFVSYPDGSARKISSDLNSYSRHVLDVSMDSSTILALPLQQNSNIWIAGSDDLSLAKQITSGTSGRHDGLFGLGWASDGRIIYTARNGDSQAIWRMNDDGTEQRQLTPDGNIDSMPSVSADGQYVAFQSERSGERDVWRMNGDGGNLLQLTTGGKNLQPDISPDGRAVVYSSGGLWIVPIDGGTATRLTDISSAYPCFSPDGKRIAYQYHDTDGTRHIAVISSGDGALVKTYDVPQTANFRNGMQWKPDGRSITYRDWADGVWEQPLTRGEPKRIDGLPKGKLYTYAWSTDGKRFAFTPAVEIRDVVLISGIR